MDYETIMRIKGAQHDLIAAVGGIERAARLSSMATSTVGRWHSPSEAALMPITAVVILEKAAGFPWVSRVLAEANGWSIGQAESIGSGTLSSVTEKSALASRSICDLIVAMSDALGDGHVTPAEAAICDKPAARAEALIVEIRKILSAARLPADQRDAIEKIFAETIGGRS